MGSSIFTKIINGEIKGTIVHQDENCVVLVDIQPQAPKHFLVVPRKEISSLDEASVADKAVLGHLLFIAAEVARKNGIAESGYRVVINTNGDGGQSVPHIHLHVLGGRPLNWPPG